MGYMRHDAIVVTSWDAKYLTAGIEKAAELGLPVSGVVKGTTNGYVSFLIAPDGSKEGWAESDRGDEAREKWMDWADDAYKKGVYLQWVHVSFAGDEYMDTAVKRQASSKEE
jgi:ABC-type sugar transport system substrate-binding protein